MKYCFSSYKTNTRKSKNFHNSSHRSNYRALYDRDNNVHLVQEFVIALFKCLYTKCRVVSHIREYESISKQYEKNKTYRKVFFYFRNKETNLGVVAGLWTERERWTKVLWWYLLITGVLGVDLKHNRYFWGLLMLSKTLIIKSVNKCNFKHLKRQIIIQKCGLFLFSKQYLKLKKDKKSTSKSAMNHVLWKKSNDT